MFAGKQFLFLRRYIFLNLLIFFKHFFFQKPSVICVQDDERWCWQLNPWSYGSWIYNYLCNRCLSALTLRIRTPLRRGVLDTTLCYKVCQWLAAGRWFFLGTPVSSTNKTDCHDIAEILLKVALNTISHKPYHMNGVYKFSKLTAHQV